MPSKPFNPDYASSPGQILEMHLEYYDMSAAEFARRCGRPVEFIQELLSGVASLDRETATLIVKEFGGASETWMNIESGFRQKLARDAEKLAKREAIWRRILFLPRMSSRADRSLDRNHRGLPRQS